MTIKTGTETKCYPVKKTRVRTDLYMHLGLRAFRVFSTQRSSSWETRLQFFTWFSGLTLFSGQNLGSRLVNSSHARGPGPSGQCYLILQNTGSKWVSLHVQEPTGQDGTPAVCLTMSSLWQALRCRHHILENHLPSWFIPIEMIHFFLPSSSDSFRKHIVFVWYARLNALYGEQELLKKIPSFKEWGNLTESGIWLPAAQKPLKK